MKHYKRYIEGKLSFHKLLKLKAKRRGIKRPFQEQTIGDDYYRKGKKYIWMNVVIDRLHNWYSKIIIDKETGQIIHQCEESLDKHIGHGSDKR